MKENYDELINQSHYRSGLWDAYWNVAKLFAIIAIPLLGWVIIAGIAELDPLNISLPINCDGTCKECEACNHHRIELESLRQAYKWERENSEHYYKLYKIELNYNLSNPVKSEYGIPISPYPVED